MGVSKDDTGAGATPFVSAIRRGKFVEERLERTGRSL
jgi:hypothetical protein